jgi:hypothetical protein
MRSAFRILFMIFALWVSTATWAQTNAGSCAITFEKFNPGDLSAHVRNVSGKTIVGLSFYAALADATEHWKWVHRNMLDYEPLREFGWNRAIKAGQKATLSWDGTDLDFNHGSGGVFVLTNVLFEDGTSWEERPDAATCKAVWFNYYKKSFTKPIELPVRK